MEKESKESHIRKEYIFEANDTLIKRLKKTLRERGLSMEMTFFILESYFVWVFYTPFLSYARTSGVGALNTREEKLENSSILAAIKTFVRVNAFFLYLKDISKE